MELPKIRVKTCPSCLEDKPFSEFRKSGYCKPCANKRQREWNRAKVGYPRPRGRKAGWRKTKPAYKCFGCGADYHRRRAGRDQSYCSMRCKREHDSKLVQCDYCGNEFRKPNSAISEHNFCSGKCRADFAVGSNNPNWRGGNSKGGRGRGWARLSDSIRKRDFFKCQWCGKSENENGARLSVDHIKPWRTFQDKAQANNRLNLVSLCRSCHGRKNGIELEYCNGNVVDMLRYIEEMTKIAIANEAISCRCHEVWENR